MKILFLLVLLISPFTHAQYFTSFNAALTACNAAASPATCSSTGYGEVRYIVLTSTSDGYVSKQGSISCSSYEGSAQYSCEVKSYGFGSCPSGSSSSPTGQCICEGGQSVNTNGTCSPPPENCEAGSNLGQYTTSASPAASACINGCTASAPIVIQLSGGTYYSTYSASGTSCTIDNDGNIIESGDTGDTGDPNNNDGDVIEDNATIDRNAQVGSGDSANTSTQQQSGGSGGSNGGGGNTGGGINNPVSDGDRDDDGISDESDDDIDGDGIPNGQDNDIDGDGIINENDPDQTGSTDQDNDGIPDALDNDIDGDGILNEYDSDHTGLHDTDGDGIPDGQDNDIDGDGIINEYDTDVTGASGVSADCSEVPESVGDPQLSAIHKQLWINNCEGPTDAEVTNEFTTRGFVDPDSIGNIWDSEHTSSSDMTGEIDSAVSSHLVSASGSGTCPFTDISLPFGVTMSGTDLCPMVDILRSIILAFAYITAASILFSALTNTKV